MMLGGLKQPSLVPDAFFVEDVVDHLFEEKGRSGGLDLLATNIMRGRDHGLQGDDGAEILYQVDRGEIGSTPNPEL